ncbi:hypothetical protein Fmac_017545 [Flemingia macrophylla]|uniref:Uncharacterized protein n=1 Tax=Flemingia macrophylla TaxID=520843 RepID=A0ABD1M2F9_9FABA
MNLRSSGLGNLRATEQANSPTSNTRNEISNEALRQTTNSSKPQRRSIIPKLPISSRFFGSDSSHRALQHFASKVAT